MGKGFYISKTVGIVGIVLAAGAVATIIALSVVYSQEKAKNNENEVQLTTPRTTAATGLVPTTSGTITGLVPTTSGTITGLVPTTSGTITGLVPTTSGTITGLVPTTAPSNEPWDQWRLPQTLLPESYNVTLWPRLQPDPNLGVYYFTGMSSVVFKCVQETDLILIHSNKLNLTSTDGYQARLLGLGTTVVPTIQKTWMQETTQYLVIELKSKLKPGDFYALYTEFVGELADDLAGFYRSEYNENGVKKIVATSQMHPTHARKTFPCFDEPAMRAVFNITLVHDMGTVALSNGMETEKVDTILEGQAVTVTTFESTKKMSTYLLALIVSDYTNVISAEQTLIRIWARKKAIEDGHGDYALRITGPILMFFEKYYNVPYPLSKSDQIALPDFYFGAMENWGLVTYRETNLLYDSVISSNANKEKTATIIAHELAHMWFGNLVTLRWWNEVWLNEGFASYVSYLGADFAEPSWNVKDLIILKDVHRAFSVDALASSHPLSSKEEDITKPEQISEQFDAVSYSKGASVLRMLSDFLTEPVFVQGLNTYLDTFAYQNTVGEDLWKHLQIAVDKTGTVLPLSVKEIMDRWVLQMGFPVVMVNTTTGQVSQKHFLLDPDSIVERPSPFNYEWIVPINWMKAEVEQSRFWLLERTGINEFPQNTTGNEWVLVNLNITGYFRVNYDTDNWEHLLNQLTENHKVIPVINRAQIVDDAFNLARAKMIPVTLALSTTKYLFQEREYMPWQSALDNLDYFYLMFTQTDVYGFLQNYLKKQVTPLFAYFKNITEDWSHVPFGHTEQYNQVNAIRVACSTGVDGCQNLTLSWFRQWMDLPNHNPIHPNLRSTVYCSAIAAGGSDEWDFGWQMFKNATIAIEADKLMSSLSCTKDRNLLERYLEYTLDASKIRKQDATSVIVYIASNPDGQTLAWEFVRKNWEYMFTEYGVGSFNFANLISGITKSFSTESELEQLQQFKSDNAEIGFGPGATALEQAIETTKANIKWVTENLTEIKDWLMAETA
ncbi:aminopeptidase N-like isoform X3 [Xyrauchen texanus]|uniref:aminopeptidase N-like isoform X3 n=1 Tax=Xyrauchen texanus TaxID=154827 RepID=UPI0022421C21|nr:aminopeptidase N-like isoform X3 [Xyrauchen texanus]